MTRDHFDFIVVGSGSGALAAAVVLADAGLDVALFEKAPLVGGGTAYSGGVVWAPCNHIMKRKGLEDSAEDALKYLELASDGRGDSAIARAYVENVGAIVEQVEDWTGIKWVIWPGQPDYYPELDGARLAGRAILQHPNSADDVLIPAEARWPELKLVRPTPHMDLVPGFQRSDRSAREAWVAGRAVIGSLFKACLERKIPVFVSLPARRLIVRDGAVVGIEVEDGNGTREIHSERGVLLNTGGFDWNDEFARRFLPGPTVVPQTPTSNTGDGHRMAMALGAATALMDKAVWHPSILIPGDTHDNGAPFYRMFNAELCKPHCFVVNRTGRRFGAESPYFALSDAWTKVDPTTREHPNVPSFFVADSQYRRKYGLPGLREHDPTPGWITEASSPAELARRIDADPEGLEVEIEMYNAEARIGIDLRFGRGGSAYDRYWGDPDHEPNPTMGPVEEAPFYAFPVHPSHAGTRGGVVTTGNGEVVDVEGRVTPGLYACGNIAANLLFGAGYGSGSAVGSSLVFGYLAAKHAAGR